MSISFIKNILSVTYIDTLGFKGPERGTPLHYDQLYQALMLMYLTELYQLMLESWHRFADAQKKMVKEREERVISERKRRDEDKAIQLEALWRAKEKRGDTFFDGNHLGLSQHLNFPI